MFVCASNAKNKLDNNKLICPPLKDRFFKAAHIIIMLEAKIINLSIKF